MGATASKARGSEVYRAHPIASPDGENWQPNRHGSDVCGGNRLDIWHSLQGHPVNGALDPFLQSVCQTHDSGLTSR